MVKVRDLVYFSDYLSRRLWSFTLLAEYTVDLGQLFGRNTCMDILILRRRLYICLTDRL